MRRRLRVEFSVSCLPPHPHRRHQHCHSNFNGLTVRLYIDIYAQYVRFHSSSIVNFVMCNTNHCTVHVLYIWYLNEPWLVTISTWHLAIWNRTSSEKNSNIHTVHTHGERGREAYIWGSWALPVVRSSDNPLFWWLRAKPPETDGFLFHTFILRDFLYLFSLILCIILMLYHQILIYTHMCK